MSEEIKFISDREYFDKMTEITTHDKINPYHKTLLVNWLIYMWNQWPDTITKIEIVDNSDSDSIQFPDENNDITIIIIRYLKRDDGTYAIIRDTKRVINSITETNETINDDSQLNKLSEDKKCKILDNVKNTLVEKNKEAGERIELIKNYLYDTNVQKMLAMKHWIVTSTSNVKVDLPLLLLISYHLVDKRFVDWLIKKHFLTKNTRDILQPLIAFLKLCIIPKYPLQKSLNLIYRLAIWLKQVSINEIEYKFRILRISLEDNDTILNIQYMYNHSISDVGFTI